MSAARFHHTILLVARLIYWSETVQKELVGCYVVGGGRCRGTGGCRYSYGVGLFACAVVCFPECLLFCLRSKVSQFATWLTCCRTQRSAADDDDGVTLRNGNRCSLRHHVSPRHDLGKHYRANSLTPRSRHRFRRGRPSCKTKKQTPLTALNRQSRLT